MGKIIGVVKLLSVIMNKLRIACFTTRGTLSHCIIYFADFDVSVSRKVVDNSQSYVVMRNVVQRHGGIVVD